MSLQPEPVDLIVHGAFIATMNDRREHYGDGAVAVTAGRIVAVGETSTLRSRYIAAQSIDARRTLLLPGLIDTHVHIGLNLNFFKPPQDIEQSYRLHAPAFGLHAPGWVQRDADYPRGLTHFYATCADTGSEEQSRAATLHWSVLATRAGTTFAVDGGGGDIAGCAEAAAHSGLRVALTKVCGDLELSREGGRAFTRRIRDTDTVLEENAALCAQWAGAAEGRLGFWFSLFGDVIASDELIRGIARLAAQRHTHVHSHSGAQASHDELSRQLHGKRGVQRMDDLGLIGPNWLGVHMGYLDATEAARLAARGAHVSHVPSTSAFYGKGIISDRTMPMLSNAGVNVVLGTDDSWNGTLLEEGIRAHCFHKDASGDARTYPYYHVAEMLTIRAARAIGRAHDLGSIEAGKRADFILVDVDQSKYIDPEGYLHVFIKRGTPADIATTVVDGQVLMQNRMLTRLDEERIHAELRALVSKRWAA